MKLTDADAIISTVFLCIRGVGRILLPLDILHACRTQRSCCDAPRTDRRPRANRHDRLVNRSLLHLTYPHLTKIRRSGLFSLFTVVMVSTHFVLISTNQTTLERLYSRDTKEREKEVLDQMHSTCAFRCVHLCYGACPRVLM